MRNHQVRLKLLIVSIFFISLFLAPVVVTSQTHTGPYPVTVQSSTVPTSYPPASAMAPGVYPMPQPHYGGVAGPNPMVGGGAPYGGFPNASAQPAMPYPSNTPYPMPMPQPVMNPAMNPASHQATAAAMNPPSYTEVMGNEAYQKQAPYNPNFNA